MGYPSKVESSLRILAASGLPAAIYAPPIHRFLWKRGFNVPPPHLNRFIFNLLEHWALFAVVMGITKWLFAWFRHDISTPLSDLLPSAAFSGLIWGFAMAAYYWYGKQDRNLPSWSSISSETET